MPPTVLIANGPRMDLVDLAAGSTEEFPLDPDPERAAGHSPCLPDGVLPEALWESLHRSTTGPELVVVEPQVAVLLRGRTPLRIRPATLDETRRARAVRPPLDPDAERAFLRALARRSLEQALRSPEEVLIALVREEERLEREVGREARAAEAFVAAPASPLDDYARKWSATRATLGRHHAELRSVVEARALELLPNLARLVGARVAARLLAAAGSVSVLSRMRAPRLQLLGSRRRPSPEHGPRYGLLYRADRMDELPLGRRGAYARSLAALAAIAVRADAITRADLAPGLIARRDRRVSELRRRRSR